VRLLAEVNGIESKAEQNTRSNCNEYDERSGVSVPLSRVPEPKICAGSEKAEYEEPDERYALCNVENRGLFESRNTHAVIVEKYIGSYCKGDPANNHGYYRKKPEHTARDQEMRPRFWNGSACLYLFDDLLRKVVHNVFIRY